MPLDDRLRIIGDAVSSGRKWWRVEVIVLVEAKSSSAAENLVDEQVRGSGNFERHEIVGVEEWAGAGEDEGNTDTIE